MNKKYSIGFFSIIIIAFLLLGIAYDYSYKTAIEKIENEKVVKADNGVLDTNCYYLMEVNGYIVVYYGDKKTPFEYTDILYEDLPVTIRKEIKNGKYIENLEELYGFLENYSS